MHAQAGMISCDSCSPGEYFDSITTRYCQKCPASTFAETGAYSLAHCLACDRQGEYSNLGATSCKTAGAGFKPNEHRSGTAPCPVNTFSVGATDECTDCVGGHSREEASSCVSTPPGYYWNNTHDVPCPAGTFSADGASSLSLCGECNSSGQFSSEGAAFCSTNGAGTSVNDHRSDTSRCPANTFSVGATDSCTSCLGGHSKPGSASCISTPPGYYWNSTHDVACPAGTAGQGECLACDGNGEYSKIKAAYCSVTGGGTVPLTNRSGVEDCPADTYSIGESDACTSCEEGGHSLPGSSSCFFCRLGEAYDDSTKTCLECAAGYSSLGDVCEKCDDGREFAANPGAAVCSLSPPGQMPNANHTDTVKCPDGTDLDGCLCPVNTFLSKDGKKCAPNPGKGVNGSEVGMTLETLRVLPGFWRSGDSSEDVRACSVAEACIGGNETTDGYCRDGHEGPYCNLCDGGWAKDALGLCLECTLSKSDVVVTLVLMVVGALVLLVVNFALNKLVFKANPRLKKSIKTGLKILFVSYQILAALPTIVPAISLPENYKESLSALQPANMNLFQLISVGCYSGSWNVYHNMLAVTVTPLVICGVLVLMKKKQGAIAVTYLVLPTVTTSIFSVFSCDKLDSGEELLFSDYAVSCKDEWRTLWVAYAVLMLLVYPVGVIALYASLLFKNRERIKMPEKERGEDEGLQSLAFLYDAYEPQYWWFEVFETARRLAMTGVLGAISPGSTLQLGAGILMTVIGFGVYCLCMPYVEIKDDILGVMTNFQIFLVMLTALVMKVGGGEGNGVGVFLIVLNALSLVVLVGFGIMQVYSVSADGVSGKKSENGLAMGVLKGGRKESGEEEVAIDMKENPLRAKHMANSSMQSGGGAKDKGSKQRQGEGWTRREDQESGHPYWENNETGLMQWEEPSLEVAY